MVLKSLKMLEGEALRLIWGGMNWLVFLFYFYHSLLFICPVLMFHFISVLYPSVIIPANPTLTLQAAVCLVWLRPALHAEEEMCFSSF